MVRRPTISFCMIMRDSAATLVACLESVVDLCDEIVVVDTGSSDDSASIARSFGARVIPVSWTDDFSAARNAYLAEARGSWILSLDADEYLNPVRKSDLHRLLASVVSTAFVFSIRNYVFHDDVPEPLLPSNFVREVKPGIGYVTSRTVRLFPRTRRTRYCYPVHESLVPSLRSQRIRIRSCAIPIHHMGYLSGNEHRRTKATLYENLGLAKIAQYSDYFLGYFELGKVYLHQRQFDLAYRMFQDTIRLNPRCRDAYFFLALTLLRQGKYAACRASVQRALRQSPGNRDARHLMSVLNQLETQRMQASSIPYLNRSPTA